MSSPRFQEAIFNDDNQLLTLENSIRNCGAFAGIHDYDFQDTIDENFLSFAAWTGDALATWDTSASTLDATGGGSSIWYEARHSTTEVPPSFVASFDLISGEGAFVFHGRTDDSTADCYIAWWDASTCGFARVAADKTSTNLTVMPYGISGPARIQVQVKWKLDSVDESRKWLLMSMHVDGRQYVCYADDIGGTAYDWANDFVGFAVTDSDNMEVDNLTIQEFTRIVDYLSIDPSETPSHGMSRAIGTSRVAYICRFDGTLRVWRPGNRTSDWTVPTARVKRFTDRDDRTRAVTHIRAVGAMHSVDRFDDDEGDIHLHRFVQVDDPNLMSEDEVYAEAGYLLAESEEMQLAGSMVVMGQPLSEAHDVVTFDSVAYRVVGIQSTMARGAQGVYYVTTYTLRRYVAV